MLPSWSTVRTAFTVFLALGPIASHADDVVSPPGQSTFISPDNHVAFAFTVPETEDHQYPEATFFSLRVPNRFTWGAVGLGNSEMSGALFFIIYRSADGNNVTFSPRVAYGNNEPSYWDKFQYTVITNSTGIFDGYMSFTAMCTANCRSWPKGNSNGGWLDVSSPNQKAIFAVGPSGVLKSDDKNAPLKFHREFGVFTIDLGRTRGAADAPILDKASQSEGTSLDWDKSDQSDYKTALHATFMIFFILAMMNGGAILLRVYNRPTWHAVNQTVAILGVLSGLALGVLTSFNYNRSRSFRHYHQIIGYIVVAFILGQFGLGLKHHLEYRRTKAPTWFGKIHLWLGRLIMFLAAINSFIGFAFAQNERSAIFLAIITVLAAGGILFYLYGRKRFCKRKQRFQPVGPEPPPPWRQTDNESSYDAPPSYEPHPQGVDLQTATTQPNATPWRSNDPKDHEDEPHLGSVQKPREFA